MKKFFIIVFFLFILLFSFSSVKATWVSGTMKITLDFIPDMEKTFVYSAGGPAGVYTAYVKGTLNESFILDQTTFFLKPGETIRLTAKLKLPQTLDPGIYGNFICFLQGEPTNGESGSAVVVRTESCAIINIRSLYSEPKIEINLNAPNLNINEKKEFSINVNSWTEQNLDIRGSIKIKNSDGTVLKTLKTEEKKLLSGKTQILHSVFNAHDFSQGKYNASAVVFYTGGFEEDEKTFEIGALDFDILNFTKQFEADKINPFEIEIKSYWNNDVTVDAVVYLRINDSFVKFGETPPFDIKPLERKKITGYFDANGLRPINYDSKVVLYYEGKTTEKTATIVIIPKERIVEMPASTTILLAILIIIVLFLIFIVIFMMRKLQKQTAKTIRKKKKIKKKKS